jgi:hypothetical protein
MWQVFSTALCSTRRRRGRHRWDALRPDKHPAVMARRSGQGMKPLAARACARPLTAPSTMTLLEEPNRGRCAIKLPDPPFSNGAGTVAFVGGLPSRHLPLDPVVGSLAACPIPSLRWRKPDSNSWSPVRGDNLRRNLALVDELKALAAALAARQISAGYAAKGGRGVVMARFIGATTDQGATHDRQGAPHQALGAITRAAPLFRPGLGGSVQPRPGHSRAAC